MAAAAFPIATIATSPFIGCSFNCCSTTLQPYTALRAELNKPVKICLGGCRFITFTGLLEGNCVHI